MDKHLIEKFFNGRATEEEARIVLKWYLSKELDEKATAFFEECWNENYGKLDWNAEKKFAELEQQLQLPAETAVIAGRPAPTRVRRIPFMIKAAAVLLLLTGGLLFSLQRSGQHRAAIAMVVKTVGPGERTLVTLPDSSRVFLHAGSSIAYEKDFAGDNRQVILNGEAFFEVVSDEARPFVVRTGAVSTRVLGTSFDIRYDSSRTSADSIRVFLVSGKVSVAMASARENGRGMVLRPGQCAYTGDGNVLLTRSFNPKEVQWKDGLLYFDAVPFHEVLKKVEQWYGVNISLHNNAGNRLYSGEFKNESLQNLLESMAFSGGFTFTISDKDVNITFGN